MDKDFYNELSPAQKRAITFTNHLSPLIRWITSCFIKSKAQFQNVAGFKMSSRKFDSGLYLFKIYKTDFLINEEIKESLHLFCCLNIDTGKLVNGNNAEILINTAINDANDLNKKEIKFQGIQNYLEILDAEITKLSSDSFSEFKMRFMDREKKRLDRTINRCRKKIKTAERSIQTAIRNNNPTDLFKGRILRQERLLSDAKEKYRFYENQLFPEYYELAGGVIKVEN